MKNRKILLVLSLLLPALITFSQKKLVIMGSSTAAGTGASSLANSWAGKTIAYFNRNTADGIDTIVENLGANGGKTSYHEMPTDFPPTPGRPAVDPLINVTYALRNNPDIIIINLPSNDVANGYTKKEFMNNLRYMFNYINSRGTVCYITTTQPRIDLAFISYRDSLRTLVDSIKNNFGIYAIDFWSDLVSTDGTNNFKDEVFFDGIHVNDIGHNYLFNRVVAKNIFSNGVLPVKLISFNAYFNKSSVALNWQTDLEEPNTIFEVQRSGTNNLFSTVYSTNLTGRSGVNKYEWIDAQPLPGKSLYRLKIIEPGQAMSYSSVQVVQNRSSGLNITKIASETGHLLIEIQNFDKIAASISIFNNSGALLYRKQLLNSQTQQQIYIPAGIIGAGILMIKLESANGQMLARRFMR